MQDLEILDLQGNKLASIGWSAITTKAGQELTQQILSNLIAGKPITNIDIFDVVLKVKIGGITTH
ncbi:MAG: hypothetical protein EAZ95_02755 [Bacteroidetes bacterium]|nr:MAG: hypothetical protein EAZ95_02755 [Bacteroidota bacterium]